MSDETTDIESVIKFRNAPTRLFKGGFSILSECAYIYRISCFKDFYAEMEKILNRHKRRYIYHYDWLEKKNEYHHYGMFVLDKKTRNKLQVGLEINEQKIVLYPYKNCIPKTIKDFVALLRKKFKIEYMNMWFFLEEPES